MGISIYTSLLIKDYKRKAGEIIALRKELRELAKVVLEKERDQSALLMVIKTREPDFTPSSVKAIATVPKVLGLKWNQLTILILDALRNSESKSAHIQDIADYVIQHGNIQVEHRKARSAVNTCVRDRLKNMAKKGQVIRCNDTPETAGVWGLPSSSYE